MKVEGSIAAMDQTLDELGRVKEKGNLYLY